MKHTFPETIFVNENTAGEQLIHVMSEFAETVEEVERFGDSDAAILDRRVLEELMDVHGSLETLWRLLEKQHGAAFLTQLVGEVLVKNWRRGYYGGILTFASSTHSVELLLIERIRELEGENSRLSQQADYLLSENNKLRGAIERAGQVGAAA